MTPEHGDCRARPGAHIQGRDEAPARVSSAVYVALALLFSLLWASAFVAVKAALADSPPLFLMGSRFLIAGVVLLAIAVLSRNGFPASPRAWMQLAILGLLNYAG